MNFYTFSFNAHCRYVFGLILLAFFPVFGLFILGIYLEPLCGDLTRIGSYSEREFGWNKPQLKFDKTLYTDGKYSRYYDVVVLGDSFSRAWPQQQWQNYLVAATNLSVVTLDIDKNKWENIIGTSTFRENPPKVLIYESVERYFPARLKRDGQSCNEQDLLERSELISLSQIFHAINSITAEGKASYVEREKDWNNIKLKFVLNYLRHCAWRYLLGVEKTEARKINLISSAPFSSFNNHELLIYIDDFKKVSSWKEMSLLEMGCRIEGIRKRVEANGQTKFVLMVAPDKLTAYSDFLEDKDLQNISNIKRLTEQNQEVMPRIDVALTTAIRTGVLDVYLPDDTHWGSSGHQIVAETLLSFLRVQK